jgi:hypothetical protein
VKGRKKIEINKKRRERWKQRKKEKTNTKPIAKRN